MKRKRRKLEPDPDVIVTERTVRVLRRDGETDEEYDARFVAAAPPFTERQKEVIKGAAREYWEIVRSNRRKRERRRGDRRKLSLLVAFERREGERRIGERRAG